LLLHYLGNANQTKYALKHALKYTNYGKNTSDIIDRNLKKDYQTVIIFDKNISDITGYDCFSSYLTQCMHYLENADQAKYVLK